MKKLIAMLMALAMIFALCACGGQPADTGDTGGVNTGGAVENVYGTITPGVLTVATSPDYAPYEFYALDDAGNPTLAGFDIDLAKFIANELGLEIEFVTVSFNGVLSEMQSGNVDLAVAGLSPDPEREEYMDFSVTYYEGKQAFVTTKALAAQFSDLASTNSAEYSIGVQTGTIQADLAAEFSPEADIVTLPKATDIIGELLSGHLDGAYIEWDVAESYKVNYPELEILCEVPYEAEGNVIGVMKGNEALLEAVNAALTKCVDEGKFAEYLEIANDLASGKTAILDENGNIVPNE